MRGLTAFTLCVPYYRQPLMLRRQIEEWRKYPVGVEVILVDDGTPDPNEHAERILREQDDGELLDRVRLYRILIDKPWNREGARNLAATHVDTEWLCHIDIDHVMPAETATYLTRVFDAQPRKIYRFARFRVGAADETRRRDALSPLAEFGPVHPHIDSYLMTRSHYWAIGGYDEDYAGVLGGGGEFLERTFKALRPDIVPAPACLHVYTRRAIADASDRFCSRDVRPGQALDKQKRGGRSTRPTSWLRFPWARLI